jgi:hypothetical protein
MHAFNARRNMYCTAPQCVELIQQCITIHWVTHESPVQQQLRKQTHAFRNTFCNTIRRHNSWAPANPSTAASASKHICRQTSNICWHCSKHDTTKEYFSRTQTCAARMCDSTAHSMSNIVDPQASRCSDTLSCLRHLSSIDNSRCNSHKTAHTHQLLYQQHLGRADATEQGELHSATNVRRASAELSCFRGSCQCR